MFSIPQELSTLPSLEKGSPTDRKPPKWAWLPAYSPPYPCLLFYGDRTHVLMAAKQALYQLSRLPSLQCTTSYFIVDAVLSALFL